jgi:hypothetical protein
MARPVPRRDAISEIRDLLEHQRPFAHCDGCLALRLGVSLAESRAASLRLASELGFSRQRGECYTCRRTVELTAMRRRRIGRGSI